MQMNIDKDEDVKKHGAFYYIFWSVAAVALLWLNYDFLYAHLSSNAEKVNNYVPQYDELEKYELPAVASWFYLEKAQDAGLDTGYYFGSGYKRQNKFPKTLIVPQEGYKYSATVTAKAYWELAQSGKKFRNVIMLIPACDEKTAGIWLPLFDNIKLSAGSNIAVNEKIVQGMFSNGWKAGNQAFAGREYWKKHLFFLQKINPHFSVVPVIYGSATSQELSAGLEQYLYDDATLLIFFADLSTYYDRQKKADGEKRFEALPVSDGRPCGDAGIETALHYAKQMRMSSQLIDGYANDGQEEEIRASWKYDLWLSEKKEEEKDELPTLIEREAKSIGLYVQQYGAALTEIADKSLAEWLNGHKKYKPSRGEYPERLFDKAAVFVSLYNHGTMRGESGSLRAKQAAALEVAQHVRAAASEDVRFDSVKPEELANLEIRITFLTDYERLDFKDEEGLLAVMKPGIDGIVLRDGNRQGLFLPSMWQEFSDKREFLTQLKLKAGMSPTYWSDKLKAYRFRTVEIKKNGN